MLHSFDMMIGDDNSLKVTSYLYITYAAAYFVLVATIAAFTGQHVVRRVIALLGRASIIIFILSLTIFVSAISLGMELLLSNAKCNMKVAQYS